MRPYSWMPAVAFSVRHDISTRNELMALLTIQKRRVMNSDTYKNLPNTTSLKYMEPTQTAATGTGCGSY